jgi:hypothetical protein
MYADADKGAKPIDSIIFAPNCTKKIEIGNRYGGVIVYSVGSFKGNDKLRAGSILINTE